MILIFQIPFSRYEFYWVRLQRGNSDLKCQKCKYRTRTPCSFYRHSCEEGNKVTSWCAYCDYFKLEEKEKEKEYKYLCKDCGLLLENPEDLTKHFTDFATHFNIRPLWFYNQFRVEVSKRVVEPEKEEEEDHVNKKKLKKNDEKICI